MIATGLHAEFTLLDHSNRGYFVNKSITGGYFESRKKGTWVGFSIHGRDLFQECFKSEAAARNYANGNPTQNIHGDTF